MLSLPQLAPHDAHNLWYPSLSSRSIPAQAETPTNHFNNHHPSRNSNAQQSRNSHPQVPTRTLLSTLRADENTIVTRKGNIRRFGAGWLRPPGVSKTMQGIWDEKAEREEQEAVANRELAMLEAQAAADADAEQGLPDDADTGLEGQTGNGEPHHQQQEQEQEQEQERDLDEDIPSADSGHELWMDDDDDDDGGMPITEEGDGDYAGEGDQQQQGMDEATAIDGDMMMMAGRDLDEEVPEAGSYQHTDTEIEDESSEEEEYASRGMGGRRRGGGGGGQGSLGGTAARTRMSGARGPGGGGSGVLGSSVFGSSPIVELDGVAGRRSGGGPGFGRRGRNAEN